MLMCLFKISGNKYVNFFIAECDCCLYRYEELKAVGSVPGLLLKLS